VRERCEGGENGIGENRKVLHGVSDVFHEFFTFPFFKPFKIHEGRVVF
jgi:hypothetical protein